MKIGRSSKEWLESTHIFLNSTFYPIVADHPTASVPIVDSMTADLESTPQITLPITVWVKASGFGRAVHAVHGQRISQFRVKLPASCSIIVLNNFTKHSNATVSHSVMSRDCFFLLWRDLKLWLSSVFGKNSQQVFFILRRKCRR